MSKGRGHLPYGYKIENGIAVVCEEEAQQLREMYKGYLAKGGKMPTGIIGSGNGLRRNKHLCRVFETTFGCSLSLSPYLEEAACGAAIYAAQHCK